MIGDKSQNAVADFLNAPLGEADEFDVVVIQPFRIALAKGLAVHREIIAHQSASVTGVFTAQQMIHPSWSCCFDEKPTCLV